MPFFIINANGIYPIEYSSYEQACANCDAGEYVYVADSIEVLEQCLEAEYGQQEGFVDPV